MCVYEMVNVTKNMCLGVRPTHSTTAHSLCGLGKILNFSVLQISHFLNAGYNNLLCRVIVIIEITFICETVVPGTG